MARMRIQWLGLALLACSAHAQNATYTTYVDRDANAATGCTVTVAGSTLRGIDARIDADVTTGAAPAVAAVTRATCEGNAFGASAAFGASGAYGANTGAGGADVVELQVPETSLVDPAVRGTPVGFAAASAGGADALFTRNGAAGGGAIVLPGAVEAIPGPGGIALLVLAAVMLIAGVRAAKRARRWLAVTLLTFSAAAVGASFVADGQIADWQGIPAVANDPANDVADAAIDLRAVHVARQGANAYLRFDIRDLQSSGPGFTSSNLATFTVGIAGSVAITASGTPAPTIALTGGTLPAGLAFDPATGVLSGTPASGSGGKYLLQFTATNALGASLLSLTLNINQAPAITSAAATTFRVGTAGSFKATATGYPDPTFALAGALPGGVTFDASTGILSGTPAAGSASSYALTLTATNAAGTSAPQSFTLTVQQGPQFTSAATATFTVGTAGTHAIVATGTPAPTLALTGGTLPAGLAFDAATGVLSGTPAAGTGGSHPLQFTATNATGSTTQAFTLLVHQAPAITSAAAATFNIGNAGAFTVAASGFPAPAFAISGALPNGIAFDTATGALTGTPANGTGGTYALTFTASNAAGASAPQAFTLTVQQGPQFTSAAAATFTVGSTGSFTVAASGTPQPALALTAGTLPNGVTFDAATGALAGTPLAGSGGAYALTFTATNASGSGTQSFALTVNEAPSITSANAATFNIGSASAFAVTASGFPAPAYVLTGALPAGITFDSATGAFGGTPANGSGGVYPLTIVASNAAGSSAPQAFTLTVQQGPQFTSATATTFTAGSAGTFTVAANGTPAPTLALTGGTLPAGVTFDAATGTLSGTPAAGTGGVHALQFTATNVSGTGTQAFTLTVDEAPTITSANAATFVAGSAGTFTVTADGHPAATFAVAGALPNGLAFDTASGVLSGTPAAGTAGKHVLTFTATNAAGSSVAQTFTLTIHAAPAFTSAATAAFTAGVAGSTFTVAASGTPQPALALTNGTLPAGLAFDAVTGVLSGTPDSGTGGTVALEFTATNTAGSVAQAFALVVNEAPAITSANAATFALGSPNSVTIMTRGFPHPALSQGGDALPAGVAFVDNGDGTATLSGTPAAGGTFNLTLTATNAVSSANLAFTLTVEQAPLVTSAASTAFVAGSAGTFAVTTSATPAVTAIAIGGALPSGVTFNDNGDGTATLAGTPAANSGGTYPLTFTASNGVPPNGSQSFVLTVNQAPAITSANSATFAIGSSGTFTVAATGFPQPTLALTGTLPSGIAFDAATGTLSGTPASGTGGTYALTLTAGNGVGADATQGFTLTINESAAITSANAATFVAGNAGTFTVTTTGVPGGAAMTITHSGALPSGVTFVDNHDGTATLAGTPGANSGGSYPLTLTADNGVSPAATQAFVLTVNQAPAITSANARTFTVGSAGSHTITTTGFPAAAIASSGTLPAGVTLTDNGDGTATLAGTPAANSGGTYPLALTASNGAGADATQAFTLTVNEAPAITSANATTFTAGSAGTFTVTTTGTPGGASMTITRSGTLPSGVTFVDNGNGTATLAGTPAASTGGTYALTLTADNGVNPDAAQTFTLTVDEAPAITSANTTTFTVGSAGTFTVNATGAPKPALARAGTLPSGVTFVDNGDGTGTLSGTPGAVTQAGSPYALTFTADNGVGADAVQNFSLVVQCPTVTLSPAAQTFNVTFGAGFSQTFTAAGGTAPRTVALTAGALPPGVSLDASTGLVSGTATDAGSYTFQLTAADANTCASSAQTYTINVNLAAGNDAYDALGNVLVDSSTGAAFSVVANDSYPSGTTISAFDATSAGGGTVTMSTAADGSLGRFTYDPPRGRSSGTDSFTYTLSRNGRTATGTVTFTIAGRVWFIDSDASACSSSCDGRKSHPYPNVSTFQAANTGALPNDPAANDPIFVHDGTYTGALILRSGQRLIGQGATSALATLAGVTVRAGQQLPATGGTAPTLSAAGTVVTLGSGNRVHGVELGNGTIALAGNGFGALTVSENVTIDTNGQALSLVNGTATATFASVTSTGGARNVELTDLAGTLTISAGALSGASGVAFDVEDGDAAIASAATIAKTSAGRIVEITDRDAASSTTLSGALSCTGTCGGIAMSGNAGTHAFTASTKTLTTGAQPAVNLTSNTGATIAFNNGGLAITTTSGAGFIATGGGTITVQAGANPNTIATTTGTALNVANTTIGAGGLTFRSVAVDGAANGIVLNNTGVIGGLAVTGTGAAGTGGLLRNTTGSAISATAARDVSFAYVNVTNTGSHAVHVDGVVGFTFQDGNVTSPGDGNDEQGFNLRNVHGASLIEDVVLTGISEDGIQLRQTVNDGGAADVLTIRRLDVQAHDAGFGETGIELQADMASSITVLVDDSDFAINGNAILGIAASTAATHTGTFTVTANGNTFNAANAFGSGSFQALGGGAGTAIYNVTNNVITGTKFDGIRVNNDDTGTTRATITGNTITGSGATHNGEGITLRQDQDGTLYALVENNTITQVKANGIRVQAGDSVVNDGGNEVFATVRNNSVTVRGDGFGAGLLIDVGDGSGTAKNDVCANVSGNTLAGTGTAAFFDFDLTLNLNETADASLGIVQASESALGTSNNGADVSVFANAPNAVAYGVAPCTLP